jgi:multidrug efflux pump subunit AcrB
MHPGWIGKSLTPGRQRVTLLQYSLANDVHGLTSSPWEKTAEDPRGKLMWIVRLALRRPYTFVVLALLIFVLGALSIATMSVDIFPSINIPVVNVIWSYTGLSPTEMEGRIVTVTERAFTTTVNGIEHLESVSLRGVAITRLFFHPNVPIEAAIAQVNAQAQQIIRVLPPGIFPPLILQYNAASVRVILASLSSSSTCPRPMRGTSKQAFQWR